MLQLSDVGNIAKLEAFIVFVYDCFDGLNVLIQRKLPFKIEFKYILFHKPAFHWLIHSPYENTTVSMWGKRIVAEQ